MTWDGRYKTFYLYDPTAITVMISPHRQARLAAEPDDDSAQPFPADIMLHGDDE